MFCFYPLCPTLTLRRFLFYPQLQDLRKKMEQDADNIEHVEESKKRLARELEDKTIQLEERSALVDKVSPEVFLA